MRAMMISAAAAGWARAASAEAAPVNLPAWQSTVKYSTTSTGASITLYVSSQNGDAPWHVRIRGRGINVSGVARGSLTLDGANTGPTGTYSIGGRAKKPWPRDSRTFSLAQ